MFYLIQPWQQLKGSSYYFCSTLIPESCESVKLTSWLYPVLLLPAMDCASELVLLLIKEGGSF